MLSVSSLHIAAGSRFGYQTGLPWHRRSRCLVEATEEIQAGPGLHLLVAPNGSGKTTLLRTLAGLMPALQGGARWPGSVHYFSDELRADRELKPQSFFRAWFQGDALAEAHRLADLLQLNLHVPIGRLSRGNRQKVLLILAEVRLRCAGAGLLLMDEPLSGLDAETREIVTELWASTAGAAVRLVVMHELESVHAADSLLTIVRGRLCHATARTGPTWMTTYKALQS